MEKITSNKLFNSPLEVGLRSIVLLYESHPEGLDLQRLVAFDYLLVHSGDIPNGPPSIHPPSPLRAGEVAIRRGLIENGLHLYGAKGLITRKLGKDGISYVAEDSASTFINVLTSQYSQVLRERARWVIDKYGALKDNDLEKMLTATIGRWKSEFSIIGLEESDL